MKSIDAFLHAITHDDFIEAHELLEEDWKAYKKQGLKKEAKALQGLINGATALALLHIKKRTAAYEKIWPVFIKYEPLLNEVSFKEMEKYKQAAAVLKEKNREFLGL